MSPALASRRVCRYGIATYAFLALLLACVVFGAPAWATAILFLCTALAILDLAGRAADALREAETALGAEAEERARLVRKSAEWGADAAKASAEAVYARVAYDRLRTFCEALGYDVRPTAIKAWEQAGRPYLGPNIDAPIYEAGHTPPGEPEAGKP